MGTDGRPLGDTICVKAGTLVVIGAAAVNRDPAVWGPDGHCWVPERWLEPLPPSVREACLPAVYSNLWVSAIQPYVC
jgi:cytochrome P450